jgi:hypothetical protein
MIERRITLDFHSDPSQYYDYLINLMHTTYASNISQWSTCPSADESQYLACSTVWINEDIELNCAHVYRDEDNKPMSSAQQFNLEQTYFNTRMVFLERRLIQSGVRLGVVINKVVELQKHDHHPKTITEYCSGTMLLIIILLIEVMITLFCFAYYFVRRTLYRQPLADTPPKYNSINDVKE